MAKDNYSSELLISSIRPGMKMEFEWMIKAQIETGWLPMRHKTVTRSQDIASSRKTMGKESKFTEELKDTKWKRFSESKTDSKITEEEETKLNGFPEAKIEAGVKLRCARNVQDAKKKVEGTSTSQRVHQTTLKDLLVKGLLENQKVRYKHTTSGVELEGVIHGNGIRCSCIVCKEEKVRVHNVITDSKLS